MAKKTAVHIPNYQLIRNDRQNYRGGGIVAFVQSRLTYEILLSEMYEFLESLWLKINIDGEPHIFGII